MKIGSRMVRASLWALCTVLFVGLLSGEAAASDVDECSSVGKDLKELPPIAELAGNIWESTGIAAFLKRNAPLVAERDVKVREILVEAGQEVKNGEPLLIVEFGKCVKEIKSPADGTLVRVEIAEGQQVVEDQVLAVLEKSWTEGIGRLIMILVGFLLLYLGIEKKFEPLLLVPIGVGAVLCNAPLAGISEPGGLIHFVYEAGIATGFFPVIIFMGVGAMTDFGPLIANPKTVLLGGAAQFGIFFTLIGALFLSEWVTGIDFSMADASAIGIIGGADGPTAIFLAAKLSPRLLGAIAVAAYSYMALVPMIQPPIMKALTTIEERKIRMEQLRYVGKAEKVLFPLVLTMLCILLLPSAAPLMGFFMFGNLMRECGVVERLSNTTQNALINITTIFLGLGVGSKLSAEKFLSLETLGILVLGIIAFSIGTATGIMMAKVMNLCSKTKVNPLIGSAGVSAVPMAARVSQNVGSEADPQNFLLMHAMGPNVAGVIGSALAAGALLAVFG